MPVKYFSRFRKEKFDIVIDDINKIPFYTPLYVKEPLLAVSHHFFGKSIFRQEGIIPGTYVYTSEKFIDFIYKKTPFAVVSQSTLDEFLERGFSKNNFRIIPNAIDEKKYSLKVGEKKEPPVIAYFGRLKKYKSVDHLLKAFAVVSEKIPAAELHIIGDGDFRSYLEELAEKLNIKKQTIFFGYIPEVEKNKLLSEAYCVVNTSIKEGWGITNIEANACGTPVISANVPGLKDSVSPGLSGLLYEYGNIKELSELLIQVVTNNEERKKLSEGAVKWAKNFSWENSAELMLEYCKDVIENHKRKKT